MRPLALHPWEPFPSEKQVRNESANHGGGTDLDSSLLLTGRLSGRLGEFDWSRGTCVVHVRVDQAS